MNTTILPRRIGREIACAGFALGLAAGTAVADIDPRSILSPRPDGWIVDQPRLLDHATVTMLNELGDAVHQHDGAEMAVVVLRTTAGGDARQFATNLFNHWGIGDSVHDNGLLIFVAIDDRAAEIVLGDGIDNSAGVALSERIMQRVMVPLFKSGDNTGAIVAGARACAREFFGVAPGESGALTRTPGSANRRNRPFGLGRPEFQRYELMGFGGAGVGVLGLLGWIGGRALRRRRPRRCGRCSMTMQLLDETTDDAHLSPGEQTEERVASVDYDVWHCAGCGSVEKFRYGRFFSRYARCPTCGAKTKGRTTETLVLATEDYSGVMLVHEVCENCDYAHSYERTVPRLSSSRGSSSSGSSGFGGGSSSGRGASGRW